MPPGKPVEGFKENRHLVICALFLIVAAIAPPRASGQVERLKAGVTKISTDVGQKGSGFIVRLDMDRNALTDVVYIVTAAHVVGSSKRVQVGFYQQNKVVEGIVMMKSDDFDLAVVLVSDKVNIPNNLVVLTFESSPIPQGDAIQVIGHPRLGADWSIVRGSVEAVKGGNLLFSGDIGEGMSGAPVLRNDRVVGVVKEGSNLAQSRPAVSVSADIVIGYLKGSILVIDKEETIFREINSQEFRSVFKQVLDASLQNFESIKGPYTRRDSDLKLKFYVAAVTLPGSDNAGEICIDTEKDKDIRLPASVDFTYFHGFGDREKAKRVYAEVVRNSKAVLPKDWTWREYQGPGGTKFKIRFEATHSKNGPKVEIDYTEFEGQIGSFGVVITFTAKDR